LNNGFCDLCGSPTVVRKITAGNGNKSYGVETYLTMKEMGRALSCQKIGCEDGGWMVLAQIMSFEGFSISAELYSVTW
jgi:hypothetical protein